MLWALVSHPTVPSWRPDPLVPDATLAFTTRRGGVSAPPHDTLNLGRSTADDPAAVEENRRRVLESLGLDPHRLATAGQVHGTRIAEVTAPGLHPDCDALVTRAAGVALAVTCADCLPILLVAPGAVAAVHCGWRGAAGGIAAVAVRALREVAGVPAARITAHLGPSIRACCYAVGPEVAERFPGCTVAREGGAVHLDLAAAARRQLLAEGLPEHAVLEVPACTACDAHGYFSHRRDRGTTGRHWAIVARAS